MKKNLSFFAALMAWMAMGSTAQAQTKYGIYIGETMVTSANASNILNDSKATFRYNASTKTLTVTDANLTNTGSLGCGIDNREVDGLTIQFIGTNVFSTRNECIASTYPLTIKGPGTLTGTSSQSVGIHLGSSCTTCVIDNGLQLNITASKYGLRDYVNKASLTVKHKDTRISLKGGSSYYTYYNLKSLTLQDGLYIYEPEGGSFSASAKSVVDKNNNPYIGEVIISSVKNYDVWVAGKRVTSENASNIQDGVSYADGTLTLNNASVKGMIRSKGSLTVNVIGNSTITTEDNPAFWIEGTGSNLYLSGSTSSPRLQLAATPNVNVQTAAIALDGADMHVTSNLLLNMYAAIHIQGTKGTEELYVTGTGTRLTLTPIDNVGTCLALQNIGNLSLGNGLYITNPDGGYFSSSLKSITVDGKNPYWGSLLISKEKPAGISDAAVSGKEVKDSYDLNGRRLSTPQKGVNILRHTDGSVNKVVIK